MHNLYAISAKFLNICKQVAGNLINESGNIPRRGVVPRFSDLEVIALNMTSEAIGIDSESLLFAKLQAFIHRLTDCGRTLFDLQQTVHQIKAATSHLKGLKIGIMGCIVNGPGEMADADYGYVGAAVGKVSLYKNKECIERNIPQEEALTHLIDLIKANGDWTDPQ